MADDEQPIIIKKINKIEAGHHGGAWKVAYADFVTAMMAFFLLLWLLNVSTEESLSGIADYFKPTAVSSNTSGSGGVMGGLTISPEGQLTSQATPIGMEFTMMGKDDVDNQMEDATAQQKVESGGPLSNPDEITEESEDRLARLKAEEEERAFKDAMQKINQAIAEDETLADLSNNLLVDMTPEGLRIQIVDQSGRSMFPIGQSVMYDDTYRLIAKVTQVIEKLPNKISIRGHTDSVPYGEDATYTNWDLSADRANASRRALIRSGLTPKRVENVVGKADTDYLFPADPTSPQNRRISIILLRDHKMPQS